MAPCANCGHAHDGAFCPACGQKRVVPGIRLKEVLEDALASVFNIEGPFLNTLRTFLSGPAKLTRAFIAGRRKSFTPPVRYFLFGMAFYYLVRWVLQWDPVDAAVASAGGMAPPDTPAMRVNHWMSRHVNLLQPILIALLATFDRVLFPRTGLRWVERLVHYTFTAGTYLFISSTLLIVVKFWPPAHLLSFVIILGIVAWACVHLHRRGVWTVMKAW
ncbi:MAG: DUF3667 domain-containing protein [Flavobacteriales bacterium]|nr:DUF3667 domain-containing protein [Flavobacteriales bacterium]